MNDDRLVGLALPFVDQRDVVEHVGDRGAVRTERTLVDRLCGAIRRERLIVLECHVLHPPDRHDGGREIGVRITEYPFLDRERTIQVAARRFGTDAKDLETSECAQDRDEPDIRFACLLYTSDAADE